MTYTCKKCGRDNLLIDEMHRSTFIYLCKECYNTHHREQQKGYRVSHNGRKHVRAKNLKQKYGITIDEYEEILKAQLNGCAICKREFSVTDKPNVDHHHGSMKIRGILCRDCNLALGYLREDEDIIWNMLEYLKRTTWSDRMGESNVATVQ